MSKSAASLGDVLAYENERVLRDVCARRRLDRAEAESLWRELLKLLWLSNARGAPPSYPPILHELWRDLVVDTQEYARFCAHHFGRMLPFDPGAKVDPTRAREEDADAAIAAVYAAFGRETATLWFDALVHRYLPWRDYATATAGQTPSATLRGALRRFERRPLARSRVAIDLGSGGGCDTRALLQRGWRVLAIDAEVSALTALLDTTDPDTRGALTLRCARFEQLDRLPRCDLVNASLALPFCARESFPRVWDLICRAIRAGGRFAGDFLGETDPWASSPRMTSHSVAEVRALLRDFQIERLSERTEVGPIVAEGEKRWHLISVVARRLRRGGGG